MRLTKKTLLMVLVICLAMSLLAINAFAADGTEPGTGHEVAYVPAAEACHANGSAEYWFCPECEAVYADEAGTILTNRKNLTIPATGENIPVTGDYTVVVFAVMAVVAMAGVVVLTKKKFA